VAFLLHSFDYPPNDGGIARLCSEFAVGCARMGLSLRVLSQAPPNEIKAPESAVADTRVTRRRPWRELDAYRYLRRLPGRVPVICGIWYPEGLLALLAGVRPLIVYAHGMELFPARAAWRRGAWGWLLRTVCESADLVVANSGYTRSLVLRVAPRARVTGIPLAVDHYRFAPGDRAAAKIRMGVSGRLVVSSVSRLCAYKGHDVVLTALAALSPSCRSRFAYLVAGKGPYQENLRRLTEQLGLGEVVRFLGAVAEEGLPDVYRASDLFVLCTRESEKKQEVEGFGLVFLEAQACGTPVVGTRTGGIPDAVNEGEGGWLIAQDDSTALARILNSLADDPERFRRAGAEARRRVERECTWDQYTRRFVAALGAEGIELA
jgi:phosphatidylinositol alpha-1,6-mannosyltransferase